MLILLFFISILAIVFFLSLRFYSMLVLFVLNKRFDLARISFVAWQPFPEHLGRMERYGIPNHGH